MTETTEAPALPVAKHTREADRLKTVPLEWPVEFDGKVFESVTVRRMTVGQIAEFLAGRSEAGATWYDFPMFDAPPEVMRALDDDDGSRLLEAANDFLPRRFRGEAEG